MPISIAAAVFSLIICWYSAGEQVLCAIMNVRRAIVSHDAQASSASIIGADIGEWRGWDFMDYECSGRVTARFGKRLDVSTRQSTQKPLRG